MSFFAVAVKSGQEIEAKEMLKSVFSAARDVRVKAIYALESFTHILEQDPVEEVSEYLDEIDIADYLQAKRIKENLSTLRTAHAKIPWDNSEEMTELRHSYQEEINQQSRELQSMHLSKKIYTVMKGYILLELKEELLELPKDVWQMVKRVPKVRDIVSSYSIPQEEVDSFFETVDLTPSVEVNLIQGESSRPEAEVAATVQDQHNHKPEHMESNQDEAQESKGDVPAEQLPNQKWVDMCRFFLQEKRKTVWIPLPLYRHLQKNKRCTCDFLAGTISLFARIPRTIRLEMSG